MRFQTGYGSIGDDMAIEDIPKGGAYWMEDIMRGLKEVKINKVHVTYVPDIVLKGCVERARPRLDARNHATFQNDIRDISYILVLLMIMNLTEYSH